MDIGSRLRELRLQRGLKLTAVAKAAGISQSSLSFIETGVNNPTVETLARILDVLGITLYDFFAIGKEDIPPHLQSLIDSARRLTPDQVDLLAKFLQSITASEPPVRYEEKKPEPEPAPEPEQTWSRWEPLAAHREDGDFMADFPDEVIQNIEEFKRFHIEETEKERKKKKKE